MSTQTTRLQRLETEQRKQEHPAAQHIFDHGPAVRPRQAYSHAAVVAGLLWRAQAWPPPVEETEGAQNERKSNTHK